MIEHVSTIFWGLVATGATGVLTYCIKQIHKFSKENKALKEGMLWLQHDRLLQVCKYFLRKKCIDLDELENLEGLYNSYRSLGGNGTIKRLYERIQLLEPIAADYDNDEES